MSQPWVLLSQNCLHCDGDEGGVANAAPGSAAKMSHAANHGLIEASAVDPDRKWDEVESRKATWWGASVEELADGMQQPDGAL